MTEVVISVRVNKDLHSHMKLHDDINWSAVIRKSITEKLEKTEHIDVERARRAVEAMNRLCDKRAFDKGKSSGEIIREWRDKRR